MYNLFFLEKVKSDINAEKEVEKDKCTVDI